MEMGKVLVINIYNEGSQQQGIKQTIIALRQRECKGHMTCHAEHTIWLGDFNLHHPMWDKGWNTHLFTRDNLAIPY